MSQACRLVDGHRDALRACIGSKKSRCFKPGVKSRTDRVSNVAGVNKEKVIGRILKMLGDHSAVVEGVGDLRGATSNGSSARSPRPVRQSGGSALTRSSSLGENT